jgi:hypothetical protein
MDFACMQSICCGTASMKRSQEVWKTRNLCTCSKWIPVLMQCRMVATGGMATPHASPLRHRHVDRPAAFCSPTNSPCSAVPRKEYANGVWPTIHGSAQLRSQHRLNFTQASSDCSAGISRATAGPKDHQGLLSILSSEMSQSTVALRPQPASVALSNGVRGSADLTAPEIVAIFRHISSLRCTSGHAAELIKVLSTAASSSTYPDAAIVTLCAISLHMGHRLSDPSCTALLLALLDVIRRPPIQNTAKPPSSPSQSAVVTTTNEFSSRPPQTTQHGSSSLEVLCAWANAAVRCLAANQKLNTPVVTLRAEQGPATPSSSSPCSSRSDTISLSGENIGSPASVAEASAARVRLACQTVTAAERPVPEGLVQTIQQASLRFLQRSDGSAMPAPEHGAGPQGGRLVHESLVSELATLVHKAKTEPGHAESSDGATWAMAALAAGHLVASDPLLEPSFEMHSATEVCSPNALACSRLNRLHSSCAACCSLLSAHLCIAPSEHTKLTKLSMRLASCHTYPPCLLCACFWALRKLQAQWSYAGSHRLLESRRILHTICGGAVPFECAQP